MSDMQPLGPAGTASDLTRCPASHRRVTDGPAGACHTMISEVSLSGGRVDTVNAAIRKIVTAAFLSATVAGCSVERIAVNMIGNALSGASVYGSDEDPELIREALPFGLKTYESLLNVSPEHRGLLLSSARGFAVYAYLLNDEADAIDATDLVRARTLRARASKLFLRGRDYALRGLELSHANFMDALYRDRAEALAGTTLEDVPFLYWAGVSWAGALSAAKDDMALIGDLPVAGALVARVLELDETFERGAAHEFFISYEGGRPGGSAARARGHYQRALDISGNLRASVHLAFAEAVTVKEQNLAEFRSLIAAALAVDPGRAPELRLVNNIAHRRAQWLESRIPDLFLDADNEEGPV